MKQSSLSQLSTSCVCHDGGFLSTSFCPSIPSSLCPSLPFSLRHRTGLGPQRSVRKHFDMQHEVFIVFLLG